MISVYLNNNEFSNICKECGGSKTTMSFHLFAAPPCTPRRFETVRKWMGFAPSGGRTEGRERVCALGAHRQSERTGVRTTRPEAGYTGFERTQSVRVTTRSAREHTTVCSFSKKVRAKVSISAQTRSGCDFVTSSGGRCVRSRSGTAHYTL